MISRRGALPLNEQKSRSALVCERALAQLGGRGVVALYAAIRGEVQLGELDAALRRASVRICYPRVDGPRLTFHEAAPAELAPAGRFKIPEPLADAPLVLPEQLDALVIPGVAYDRRGYRLGWGAGFYDALLRRAHRARRVGVCYDFQLVDECPHGPADEPVHVVITDGATTIVKEETP